MEFYIDLIKIVTHSNVEYHLSLHMQHFNSRQFQRLFLENIEGIIVET
jgi:hypothetical protein